MLPSFRAVRDAKCSFRYGDMLVWHDVLDFDPLMHVREKGNSGKTLLHRLFPTKSQILERHNSASDNHRKLLKKIFERKFNAVFFMIFYYMTKAIF